MVWFRFSHIYSRCSLPPNLGALHPPSSWANHLLQAFHWLGFTCFLTIPVCLCESSPPFLFACLQCFHILFKVCCEDVCLHCVESCHTNYIHHEFTSGGVPHYFSECDVCFEVDLRGFPDVGSTSSQANWHENISCFNGGSVSILVAWKPHTSKYVPQNLKLET